MLIYKNPMPFKELLLTPIPNSFEFLFSLCSQISTNNNVNESVSWSFLSSKTFCYAAAMKE